MGFGDRNEREESVEDVIVLIRCVVFFKRMKKEYKNSMLGFLFDDLQKTSKAHLLRCLKIHEKQFNEKLNIKLLEVEIG